MVRRTLWLDCIYRTVITLLALRVFSARTRSCAAFLMRSGGLNGATKTCRRLATKEDNDDRTLNVLALHGKGGSAASFADALGPLEKELRKRRFDDVRMECLDAPFVGGQWWTMPAGVRSFRAERYDGFDTSAASVAKALSTRRYDVVLGHSQGAILLAALTASSSNATILPRSCNLILNGVAWPNPYGEGLAAAASGESSFVAGEATTSSSSVLIVAGDRDRINAPDEAGAWRVRDCLQQKGWEVTTIQHPGGHSVPVHDETALEGIVDWIEAVVKKGQN